MDPVEFDAKLVATQDKSLESGGHALPTDHFIYRDDVVSCSKYEGLLGVVMEVAGDAESDDGSIIDSDSEDDVDKNTDALAGDTGEGGDGNNINGDENDSLPDGQIRVVWTDGSETTGNISDVTVVDRPFEPGDIVASAAEPTGQLGLVVDVSITADLLTHNGEVIKQVPSKDLKRIREYAPGDYVVQGPWLGRVDDVLDNLTILFDDGSVCKVVKADPMQLQPVSRPVIDDANCPYYPGQRIKAVSSTVFKTSRWLSGSWKATRLEGTVVQVQTASVIVYWIASAYLGVGINSTTVPSEEQKPKDLTLLDRFSYADWQLGDWCFLTSSSNGSGTSNGCNLKDRAECSHSRKGTGFVGEGLIDTSTRTHTESSGQDLNDIDLDNKHHQMHDTPNGCDDNASLEESKVGQNTSKTDESETDSNIMSAGGLNLSSVSKEPASKESTHESWPTYRKKLRKCFFKRDKKARKKEETYEKALFIVKTVTKVDVAWQDGKREYGLDSPSLIHIQTPNDHEFFPEQYVVEKGSDEEAHDSSNNKHVERVGVVRSFNAKDKTVCVRWLKLVARPEDVREFEKEEIVSAYELDEHPDYDYCYGDVVVRLSPIPVAANATDFGGSVTGGAETHDMMVSEGDTSEKHSNSDHKELLPSDEVCEDFTGLSWVGNISGLQDGDIEVTWADGMVSKVGPQAIYVVGRDDDGDSFGGGSEVSDDGASWETVDETDMNTLEDIEKEVEFGNPADNGPDSGTENDVESPREEDGGLANGPLSMPLAALGFVARLATGLFSRGRKETGSDQLDANETVSQNTDRESSSDEHGHKNPNALNCHQSDGVGTPDGCTHEEKAEDDGMTVWTDADGSMSVRPSVDNAENENNYGFKHFDITDTPPDHYFVGSAQSTGGKKWVKKVQQEWGILEKNLPEAIYVRVFEDRMDLLRAVIIGAAGTPYQDGLFFFDFHIPPEYPQVPPTVYYHSGGLRINPNLYVDGKVCLSLLNTWTGKGNEVWDPLSSSILQVLVSLQGLVLNSKPYFNEAGYEKQVGTIEGEKNSLPYNENTYLLNLKSMMYLLRRPPMHFQDLVKDHFHLRGPYILKACEAYMGDCTIGSLTKDASITEKSKEHPCSVGFKLMLAKIMPRLISAFKEAEVDCQGFEHLATSDSTPKV